MESSDPKGIYRRIAGRLSTLILGEPANGPDIPVKGFFHRLATGALAENRTLILHAGTFLFDRSLSGVSPSLRFSKKLP